MNEKTYSTEGVETDVSARRRVTLNFDLLTPKVDRFMTSSLAPGAQRISKCCGS